MEAYYKELTLFAALEDYNERILQSYYLVSLCCTAYSATSLFCFQLYILFGIYIYVDRDL
jgi:hypothetical protein